MRIAYVINSVEGGGAALPVPAVSRVLRDNGASVKVFALTRRDGRAVAPMEEAGLEVLVRDGGERDHVAALRWLDAATREWRPTHLWTSLTRATLLGQLVGLGRRLPVVSWQHAAFLKPANRWLLRRTRSLSRLWVGDSESVTALTAERLAVPPDRLVKWSIFAADPRAPQAEPWRPGETIRVGSLGRLHPVKGYDVLVAALAALQASRFAPPAPFEVVVAGDGQARDALVAQAAAAGVGNLGFAGYAGRPDEFLASLHHYVQPSRSEGLCLAAHEALQAGLPVLASRVGELPWSIEDGVSGKLVPPGDPAALAAALAGLLRTPDRLAIMGSEARARVLLRFSQAAFAETGGAIVERMRRWRP